mgnify:CR=1 FL=1
MTPTNYFTILLYCVGFHTPSGGEVRGVPGWQNTSHSLAVDADPTIPAVPGTRSGEETGDAGTGGGVLLSRESYQWG